MLISIGLMEHIVTVTVLLQFQKYEVFGVKIYVFLEFTSDCLCAYSFCPVAPLVVECVISMAAVSKTGIKHKLLSIQEKLDVMNTMDAFLLKKKSLRFCISVLAWTQYSVCK
jgi:hypothetical protein